MHNAWTHLETVPVWHIFSQVNFLTRPERSYKISSRYKQIMNNAPDRNTYKGELNQRVKVTLMILKLFHGFHFIFNQIYKQIMKKIKRGI